MWLLVIATLTAAAVVPLVALAQDQNRVYTVVDVDVAEKEVETGESARYLWRLENHDNVSVLVQAVVIDLSEGWLGSFDSPSFMLDPGEARNVTLTLTAPEEPSSCRAVVSFSTSNTSFFRKRVRPV